MGRTACTEPQCLYSRAIPLLPLWAVRPVQSLSACTVELYLFSPYGPYGLYRASVPVQVCVYLGGNRIYFAWIFAGLAVKFRRKLMWRKRLQQTGSTLCYSHSVVPWTVQLKEEFSKACVKFRYSVTEYSQYWFFILQRRFVAETKTVNQSLRCSASHERYSFISCCVMILGVRGGGKGSYTAVGHISKYHVQSPVFISTWLQHLTPDINPLFLRMYYSYNSERLLEWVVQSIFLQRETR